MNLSELKPGATKKPAYRKGRGPGSGNGKTAGRGHKGQKSRSGYSKKVGFEGGQMPLQRRVPKFGFKPLKHSAYRAINLETLQELADELKVTRINPEVLSGAGLISPKHLVKILGRGTLTAKLEVEAHAFSRTAEEAITAAGGTAVKL